MIRPKGITAALAFFLTPCIAAAVESEWRLVYAAVAPVGGFFAGWGGVALENSGAGTILAPVVSGQSPSAAPGGFNAPQENTSFNVSLDFTPEAFRLGAYGDPAIFRIEASGSESAVDIATGSVRISKIGGKAVSPPLFIDPQGPVSLVDGNSNGYQELVVQFPRMALSALLPGDSETKISVAGVFRSSSRAFEVEDGIRTLGKGVKAVEEEDQGFSLVSAYAFPNPAKGANPTFRLRTRGLADSVEFSVYNAFRELVHKGNSAAPQRIENSWAYDHSWSVSGGRTGIYFFQVTARKVGYPPVTAGGRVAVIR